MTENTNDDARTVADMRESIRERGGNAGLERWKIARVHNDARHAIKEVDGQTPPPMGTHPDTLPAVETRGRVR